MHYEDLCTLGLTSQDTAKLFRTKTRDNPSLHVYKDSLSGIIFIKDQQTDPAVYARGDYRSEPFEKMLSERKLENLGYINDRDRRLSSFKQFYAGKSICDFGCGAGDFLKEASKYATKCIGVELEESCIDSLKKSGINVTNNLDTIKNNSIDSIFFFHSFEHLNDPISILNTAHKKLAHGGKIIIEVPNANDFLISHLQLDEFIDFTLWSQHLILHTPHSIKIFLENSNFKRIITSGAQRFPLSNHLTWLSQKRPGGHLTTLSVLDSPSLDSAYADSLSKIGANDTIICIGEK